VLVLLRNDGGLITMAKVYFVRHQAGGVMHEYPFAAPPDAEQQAAISKLCSQRFGFSHSKTPGEPYWTSVVGVDLLGSGDVPAIEEQSAGTANMAGVGKVAVVGFGTVTPKGGE
jgi:hypothetical protein